MFNDNSTLMFKLLSIINVKEARNFFNLPNTCLIYYY